MSGILKHLHAVRNDCNFEQFQPNLWGWTLMCMINDVREKRTRPVFTTRTKRTLIIGNELCGYMYTNPSLFWATWSDLWSMCQSVQVKMEAEERDDLDMRQESVSIRTSSSLISTLTTEFYACRLFLSMPSHPREIGWWARMFDWLDAVVTQ